MIYSKPTETPLCPNCQTPMRLIPAGVSKNSGKAYGAFWSCPNNRECGSKTIPLASNKEKPTTSNQAAIEVLYSLKEIITILESISDNLSGRTTKTEISKSGVAKDFPGKELQADDFIPVLEEESEEES